MVGYVSSQEGISQATWTNQPLLEYVFVVQNHVGSFQGLSWKIPR